MIVTIIQIPSRIIQNIGYRLKYRNTSPKSLKINSLMFPILYYYSQKKENKIQFLCSSVFLLLYTNINWRINTFIIRQYNIAYNSEI